MTNINQIFHQELQKIEDLPNVNINFYLQHKERIQDVFGYIFVINLFKNRVETKKYYKNNYSTVFSLLLEASYAIVSGQCRGALLLLRSAQEANFRYSLLLERKFILEQDSNRKFKKLDFRFLSTKNCFIQDIEPTLCKEKYSLYYQTIERNLTWYKKLCSVVHSQGSSQPVLDITYLSRLSSDTIINSDEYFKLFTNTLSDIFLLNFIVMRDSLIHWDTYELRNILKIAYGKKKTESLLKFIKQNHISR